MSEHNLQNTIALLERTPKVLNTLLRDLPEEWTHNKEGEGTWSAYDIVGHLIHGEKTDWVPIIKWVGLLFLLLQLFWWLLPTLSKVHVRP